MNDSRPTGPLDRLLGIFGDVRAGEGVTVLLMSLNVFLLLVGYYVLKTVREPLILMAGGAELKSYAAAAQALTLIVYVPVYGWLASRLPRQRFLMAVILFFVGCIQLFFLGSRIGFRIWDLFSFFGWESSSHDHRPVLVHATRSTPRAMGIDCSLDSCAQQRVRRWCEHLPVGSLVTAKPILMMEIAAAIYCAIWGSWIVGKRGGCERCSGTRAMKRGMVLHGASRVAISLDRSLTVLLTCHHHW